MAADAVRALRDVGYRHRDQFLGLARQCAVGKDAFAEGLERGRGGWRQCLALTVQLDRRFRIHRFRIHLVFHVRPLDERCGPFRAV